MNNIKFTKGTKYNTLQTILMLLVSLICSFLIWVYVTDTEGQTIDKPFPGVAVKFQGETVMRESRGLIVTQTGVNSVEVMLNGNRRILSSIVSADLSAAIDLSGITQSGNYTLAPRVVYPSKLDTSGVVSAEVIPATVSFYVDTLKSKSIPVEGVFNGSIASGFIADPLQFNPGEVIIRGPEQVLSQIETAYVTVTRNDVDKSLTMELPYTLLDRDGNAVDDKLLESVTLDTELVSVTMPIRSVKEVGLVVELLPGGGASDANVSWKLEPNVITLTGNAETLAGLNNITVAKIDLASITESKYTENCRIVIPNDTEITSGARETVLTLELVGLESRTYSIGKGNISCTNVSEGYTWEVLTETLSNVVIRGPAEALERVSDVNIRAVANLTDYGTATGILSVPVRIVVDGNTEVGALGEYEVYINIAKASEAEEGEE